MTAGALLENGFTGISMPEPEREIRGAYMGDLLSWVMGRCSEDQAWITIMSNVNVVAVASLANPSVVILSEGVTLPDEIRTLRESLGKEKITVVVPQIGHGQEGRPGDNPRRRPKAKGEKGGAEKRVE